MRFVLFLLAASCASGNLLATARTVTKGEHQLAFAVEGLVMPVEGRFVPGGNVEGSLRLGLSEGLDLGLTASLLSFDVDVRRQLVRSSALELTAGVGAGGSFQLLTGSDYTATVPMGRAQLPLFLGINAGARHQLILSPRLLFEHWFGNSNNLLIAGNVGVSLALTDRFRLLPFIGIAKTLTTFGASGGSRSRDPIVDVGIALLSGE